MKHSALAVLVFSALLGTHAFADNGPTNPNPPSTPTTPGMGPTPADIPVPSGTDPRNQGADPGRQGGVSTDGTDRSQRITLPDENGSEGSGKGDGRTGTGGSQQ